jgi:hypothetical protein
MSFRVLAALSLLLPLLVSCGAEETEVAAPAPSREKPLVISGMYRVNGETTPLDGSRARHIEGSVILAVEGDAYTSSFHLLTNFPGPEGLVKAEVVGKGEGRVDGRRLEGTAETQILTAMFQGVDPKFPFLPQVFGPRIESTSVATIHEGGTITLEIENRAAPGQEYVPTRTTMTGERVTRFAPGAPLPDSEPESKGRMRP